ncbi:MAG TPA: aminopeptidase [Steroidobacteraceae bacterium]|jgi:predicted aminopeptidase|nr:aminopeptidase [Steroidobacteraceae bacterium]
MRRRRLAGRLRLAALWLAVAALPGCATPGYLVQAAHGQWQLMHARRPIPLVIANPATSPTLRSRLDLVEDARAFAVTELELPENGSYRSYSDLKRPYVVWEVVAAPRFSVEPLRWCFPIAGCVSYRGYFHERRARAFAARLARRGDDVMVGGVTAYSTLGHFADPVLNTMLRYGDLDLVGTIFHELAHQLIYVPGDSEFDESFAMTVQAEGLSRWLAARGRSGELKSYLEDQRQDRSIDQVFADGRNQLKRLYASGLPRAQMLALKHAILGRTGARVQALERQWHLHTGYDQWIVAGLNNADLASVGTYSDCVPGFERLLAQNGGELPRFYAAVRRISRDPHARRALCQRSAGGRL